jgi:hypothetical protein
MYCLISEKPLRLVYETFYLAILELEQISADFENYHFSKISLCRIVDFL